VSAAGAPGPPGGQGVPGTSARRPSVRMSADEIWDFVTNGHTGVFVTLRGNGVPVAMPVWFAVVDRVIYVNTRGKKLARVRNDARAAFLVESGKRWAELKAVHLTGTARVLDELPQCLHRRVQAELDRKYAAFRTASAALPRQTRNAYSSSRFAWVEFTPGERILNWDNSKLPLG
jgi:hypothetical protein